MKTFRGWFVCVLGWSILAGTAYSRDFKTLHSSRHEPRPAGVQIADAEPGQVVLYCTDVSAACKGIRKRMRDRGIPFVDKDPKNDPVAGAEYDALLGDGVPLIVLDRCVVRGGNYFDSLYAKYHGNAESESQPAPQTSTAPVMPGSPAIAIRPQPRPIEPVWTVTDIAYDALGPIVAANPVVVVQYTSDDRGCGYCVDGSFEAFDGFAARYGDKARFVRVKWSPWNRFPKGLEKMRGIPRHAVIAENGEEAGFFMGTIASTANQAKFKRWLDQQLKR
jgi:hypothetical protein